MTFHYSHDRHFKYMAGVKSTPPFRDGTSHIHISDVSFLLFIIQCCWVSPDMCALLLPSTDYYLSYNIYGSS